MWQVSFVLFFQNAANPPCCRWKQRLGLQLGRASGLDAAPGEGPGALGERVDYAYHLQMRLNTAAGSEASEFYWIDQY